MRNKKIQFVFAEAEILSVYSSGWAPPLSFLTIASYLKNYSNLEIELLDSQVMLQSEIEKRIDCDILAGSINLANYSNFLKIAQKYKEKNPRGKVIVGGPHSLLARNILRNRPYIDAVVIGDGEKAFLLYCQDEKLSKIPNLVYRRDSEILFNQKEKLNLEDLPIPDRSLVNLKPYFDNYNDEFNKPTTMYSQKGCFWGKCLFCQIKPPVRSRRPEQFWQEVKYLHDNYGIDYVWNVSDSPNKETFLDLRNSKPKDIDIALRFYARTSEIDEETAEALKAINCYEVFLGIETGDSKILQKIDKNSSLEQCLKAVEVLSKNKIKSRISFVLGLPGETEKTLENTYNFANQLIDVGADSIACSILMPVPGSKSFGMMLQKEELRKKYLHEDLFNLNELQKDWVESFCKVDYSSLVEMVKKIKELKPEKFSGLFTS